jgi:hypothetical protein
MTFGRRRGSELRLTEMMKIPCTKVRPRRSGRWAKAVRCPRHGGGLATRRMIQRAVFGLGVGGPRALRRLSYMEGFWRRPGRNSSGGPKYAILFSDRRGQLIEAVRFWLRTSEQATHHRLADRLRQITDARPCKGWRPRFSRAEQSHRRPQGGRARLDGR